MGNTPEYNRQYRLRNLERLREARRQRYAQNPEKELERNRLYREAHPEKRKTQKTRKHSPEERAFMNMKTRCTVPSHKSYQYYGGRGIEVRFSSYREFLAEVGPRPGPGYTIDRINNDGHYEPGNVRWATWAEQARNRRRAATNARKE